VPCKEIAAHRAPATRHRGWPSATRAADVAGTKKNKKNLHRHNFSFDSIGPALSWGKRKRSQARASATTGPPTNDQWPRDGDECGTALTNAAWRASTGVEFAVSHGASPFALFSSGTWEWRNAAICGRGVARPPTGRKPGPCHDGPVDPGRSSEGVRKCCIGR